MSCQLKPQLSQSDENIEVRVTVAVLKCDSSPQILHRRLDLLRIKYNKYEEYQIQLRYRYMYSYLYAQCYSKTIAIWLTSCFTGSHSENNDNI